MPDVRYWIGFNRVIGVGPAKVRALIDHFGDLDTAWQAVPYDLKEAGLDRRSIENLFTTRAKIDLDQETFRQVVVDREEGQYLGHPTTVLLEDGKTILIVYPKGHGRGEIVYKKSTDGGLTWSGRLKTPESWKTSLEVPTIFRTIDPAGKKHLILFSGLYPARLAHSEDDGLTWSGLEPAGGWGGIVVMAAMTALNTGKGHYMALFHDDIRFMTADGQEKYREDRKTNDRALFTLYKTFSYDGGLTWSNPEPILSRRDMNLCEPGIIRSPNGKTLAVLLRENSRSANSQIIF